MSNAVRFFEVVGQSPQLRHADRKELREALTRAQIDGPLRTAILDRDSVQMNALLDAENRIYCSVFPVKVPERKPSKTPTKKPGKTPSKKPSKAPSKKSVRKAPGKSR